MNEEKQGEKILIVDGEGAMHAVVRAIECGELVTGAETVEVTVAVQAPTDAEILAALQGDKCAACGGRKKENHAFCATDFVALTIFQRRQMSMALKGERFYEKYRSALRHLQLNPTRVKQLPARAGGWRHKSENDVEAAGYRFLEHARCNVPRCNVRIVWYRTPKGGKIPVNLADYQPHRTSCVDPEYFQRKREERAAQTFARRSAKRKQRRKA